MFLRQSNTGNIFLPTCRVKALLRLLPAVLQVATTGCAKLNSYLIRKNQMESNVTQNLFWIFRLLTTLDKAISNSELSTANVY